ncbi:MAG: energy transducer TonB [Pyrinomonadaceae bacterium]|nr:energy transducer TonB [Pyrinomonadaceae bacterium]
MKFLPVLFVFLIICSNNVSAQTPKMLTGGILNGKANALVKPQYPAAARAVNASGAVKVEILIDEKGNVVSAKAVSGHPLLRAASEKAALESKFAPTFLDGEPVKVSGTVVFNFVGQIRPKTFSEIGFALGVLEKAEVAPGNISIFEISDNLPAGWTEEKEKLFEFYKKPDPAPVKSEKQTGLQTKSAQKKSEDFAPKDSDRASAATGMTLKAEPATSTALVEPDQYSPERAKISAELSAMMEKRLQTEPDKLWKFKAGATLGKISAQSADANKMKAEASNLSKLIATAPGDIAPVKLENMGKLLVMIQSDNIAEEGKTEIKSLVNLLKVL